MSTRRIEILRTRVAERLDIVRKSERAASLEASANQSADWIRYIRTRNTMPSGEKLSSIARVLQTTSSYLLGDTDDSSIEGEVPAHDLRAFSNPLPDKADMPNSIPIYGTGLGADLDFTAEDSSFVAVEQVQLHTAEAIGYMSRPPAYMNRKDVYGLYVSGASMEPAFDDGDPVLVDPTRQVRPRDYVVVYLKTPIGEDGDAEITSALIKRLVRRSASFVELEQYNPPATFRVPQDRVHSVQKVMKLGEALLL